MPGNKWASGKEKRGTIQVTKSGNNDLKPKVKGLRKDTENEEKIKKKRRERIAAVDKRNMKHRCKG